MLVGILSIAALGACSRLAIAAPHGEAAADPQALTIVRPPPGQRVLDIIHEAVTLSDVGRLSRQLKTQVATRYAERYRDRHGRAPAEDEQARLDIAAWYLNQELLATLSLPLEDKARFIAAVYDHEAGRHGEPCGAPAVTGPGLSPAKRRALAEVMPLISARVGMTHGLSALPDQESGPLMLKAMVEAMEDSGSGEALPASVRRIVRLASSGRDARPEEEAVADCDLFRWYMRRLLDAPPRFVREIDVAVVEYHRGRLDVASDALFEKQSDVFKSVTAPPREASGYPRVALLFGIEGRVTVEVTLDADGDVYDVEIVRRTVQVPALLGERPLIFERVFDTATIENARSRRHDPRRVRGGPSDRSILQYEMDWKLDEATRRPAATVDTTQHR